MIFKKKRGIFSEVTDVSKICATCKFASPLCATDDLMCKKKGLVASNYICRHYDYNRLMKRPSRKRNLSTDKYSAEDFEI